MMRVRMRLYQMMMSSKMQLKLMMKKKRRLIQFQKIMRTKQMRPTQIILLRRRKNLNRRRPLLKKGTPSLILGSNKTNMLDQDQRMTGILCGSQIQVVMEPVSNGIIRLV
jgi:hypothetical protein